MLTLLSPAKTLNFDFDTNGLPVTAPRFEQDSTELLATCRGLSVAQLRKLMSISQSLAELGRERFQAMEYPLTPDNSRPAVLAFRGDVYRGLDAPGLGKRDLTWAQRRLRILSGF